MSAGKYDALLFAKHGLYPPELKTKEGWHDRMCMMNKGTYTRLSYNTNDGENTKLNQYGGTCITLTTNMTSIIIEKGSVGVPTKLGRWSWVRLGGKYGIATVYCVEPAGTIFPKQ